VNLKNVEFNVLVQRDTETLQVPSLDWKTDEEGSNVCTSPETYNVLEDEWNFCLFFQFVVQHLLM